MAEVHHFAYGWLTPALAYGVSVLGSLLGLVCTARGRRAQTPTKRYGWLALSAVSIGGTGIWMMHFLAMLGFAVVGSDVRFAVLPTVLSALLAVVVVGIGLLILGTGELKLWRVLAGGLFAGLGVAGMHYTGMAAMRLNGTVGYDPKYVALSLVIAVVAASAALWFTVVARNLWLVTGAALIMGIAVNGMHYVGMAASRVTLDNVHSASAGADVTTALPIIAGLAGVIVVVLLYSALSAPTEEESRFGESQRLFGGTANPDAESLWTPKTTGQPAAQQPTPSMAGGGGSWADGVSSERPQWDGPPNGQAPGGQNGQQPGQWPGAVAQPGPTPEQSRWAALRQRPAEQDPGKNPWADVDLNEAPHRRNSSDPW